MPQLDSRQRKPIVLAWQGGPKSQALGYLLPGTVFEIAGWFATPPFLALLARARGMEHRLVSAAGTLILAHDLFRSPRGIYSQRRE